MIINNIKTFKFALFMVPMLLLGCGGGGTPASTSSNNGAMVQAVQVATASTSSNNGAVVQAAPEWEERDENFIVHAEVVATGIKGAGAIAQIGMFQRGSPVNYNPALSAHTNSGRVLDGARLLVASTSNYGAPLANPGQYAGSILSIDPSSLVDVPVNFAATGDQASALGGAVQVFSANNAAFANSRFNPLAVTAAETGVSMPLGISINNGNGRPWIANSPYGALGAGTVTVLDPVGAPLAGAPDRVAGGVFSGDLTNRSASTTHGLSSGSIGTAILSKSPDGSTKAVFVSAEADGSIVQIHVQKGVDGLVPPGTLTPLTDITPAAAESNDRRKVVRAGMAFNWAPNRVLYVADPKGNRVVAFDITDDGTRFIASAPRVLGGDLSLYKIPVDVAPTVPEVASENFASNSTLAVGADVYVLNRGNNSIVRITQDGKFVAKRIIKVDNQDDFRASGMGVSPDGQTIWVTGQTEKRGGIVVKVPGFGSGPIMPGLMSAAVLQGAKSTKDLGMFFFKRSFSIAEGVGPLFNAQSCVACHGDPVAGGMSTISVVAIDGPHGPTVRAHSIAEIGGTCGLAAGVPADATVASVRSSMTLRSSSLIDSVQDFDILAGAAAQPADIRGHVNRMSDGRIGRFGWKAQTPTLIEFMGGAFRNEMGLTNGLMRNDLVDGCGANLVVPELDAVPLVTTAHFLKSADAPAPSAMCTGSAGATVFKTTGCASCHQPSLPGPGGTRAVLYSDLLVHDMGLGLADGLTQGSATGSEFRTMTLVAMAERLRFLHDGRANTLADAILAHGGQASSSKTAFEGLSTADRDALIAFLGCL